MDREDTKRDRYQNRQKSKDPIRNPRTHIVVRFFFLTFNLYYVREFRTLLIIKSDLNSCVTDSHSESIRFVLNVSSDI